MKWPGSPQRQQAGPGFPATLVAGSGTRNWRGDPGGTGMSAELGLADPASLAWALPAADSGAGPPLHRGWARGTTPARDLGRKIGGDTAGEERERETDGRGSPPMARHHLVLGELDGQIQRRRAVALDPLRGRLGEPRNKLLQHHLVDDMVDAAFPGQQPSAAGVPELMSHHEGPAVLPQLQ